MIKTYIKHKGQRKVLVTSIKTHKSNKYEVLASEPDEYDFLAIGIRAINNIESVVYKHTVRVHKTYFKEYNTLIIERMISAF